MSTSRLRSTRSAAQLDSREIATTRCGLPARCSRGRRSSACRLSRSRARAVTARGLFASSSEPGSAVYECERPRRQERRRGKSDLIDAALAARRLLSGEGLSLPRGGGRREDLRLLLLERRGAMQARNAALNQLSALLVTAPDHAARASGSALRGATRPRGGSAAAQQRGRERRSAAARPARRAAVERGGGGRARTRSARRRGRARAARGVRRGPGLRRPAARLERRPRPDEKRGILRRARRHQPGRRLERQAAAPPAQPRRRPPTQLGAPRHRAPTDPPPRRDRAPTTSGSSPPARPPERHAAASSAHSPATSTDAYARCQRSP